MRINCDRGPPGGRGGGEVTDRIEASGNRERSCHRQWHEQISRDVLMSSILDLRAADQTCDARTSRNKWAVQALYVVVNMWWNVENFALPQNGNEHASQRSGKKSEHAKS